MKHLRFVIKEFVKELGIEKSVKSYQALDLWRQVVGTRIAQVTDAQKIKNGKLFVKVSNDVWRNELIFYKPQMMKKLNDRLGHKIVKDIIFI
jgi:predicted nucleic acid-binding Zn ribbon protein